MAPSSSADQNAASAIWMNGKLITSAEHTLTDMRVARFIFGRFSFLLCEFYCTKLQLHRFDSVYYCFYLRDLRLRFVFNNNFQRCKWGSSLPKILNKYSFNFNSQFVADKISGNGIFLLLEKTGHLFLHRLPQEWFDENILVPLPLAAPPKTKWKRKQMILVRHTFSAGSVCCERQNGAHLYFTGYISPDNDRMHVFLTHFLSDWV